LLLKGLSMKTTQPWRGVENYFSLYDNVEGWQIAHRYLVRIAEHLWHAIQQNRVGVCENLARQFNAAQRVHKGVGMSDTEPRTQMAQVVIEAASQTGVDLTFPTDEVANWFRWWPPKIAL